MSNESPTFDSSVPPERPRKRLSEMVAEAIAKGGSAKDETDLVRSTQPHQNESPHAVVPRPQNQSSVRKPINPAEALDRWQREREQNEDN